MAPPRRVRDEALILRKPGKPDEALVRSREWSYRDAFPSQRRFLVSPDARSLAYTSPDKQTLEVVRRDGGRVSMGGAGNQELRFSPDGRTLAAAHFHERAVRIERINLARLTAERWADLPSVVWIEFCARGLVVLHHGEGSGARAFTLLPWSGEPRQSWRPTGSSRGSWSAKSGTRLVFFRGNDVMSIDVAAGGEPQKLGRTRVLVTNAEMSPDGRVFVVATEEEAYVCEGEGPLVPLDGADVHTVWFARDGLSFVWANSQQVTWQSGAETRKLEAAEGKPIWAARYLAASPGLVVSRGRDLLRWNPAPGRARLARERGRG